MSARYKVKHYPLLKTVDGTDRGDGTPYQIRLEVGDSVILSYGYEFKVTNISEMTKTGMFRVDAAPELLFYPDGELRSNVKYGQYKWAKVEAYTQSRWEALQAKAAELQKERDEEQAQKQKERDEREAKRLQQIEELKQIFLAEQPQIVTTNQPDGTIIYTIQMPLHPDSKERKKWQMATVVIRPAEDRWGENKLEYHISYAYVDGRSGTGAASYSGQYTTDKDNGFWEAVRSIYYSW